MTLAVALERWRLVEEALASGKSISAFFPAPPRPLVSGEALVGWAWTWDVGGVGVTTLMEPGAITVSTSREARTRPLGAGVFQAFTKYWRGTW